MNKHYDILIVGGGLVGYSMAYALRDLPISIALIEAVAPKPHLTASLDTRVITLSAGSAAIFSQLGLWQKMAEFAEPIRAIHVSDKGRFGFTRLIAEEHGIAAFGYVATINHLNHLLWQACQQCTNVNFICPATLTELTTDNQQATATIQYEDSSQTITASLVVAADGAQSAVRKLQKISTTTHHYHQTAIATTVALNQEHQQTAYERFTANGPIALLPLQNKECAVVWTLPTQDADTMMSASDEIFLAKLQKCFGYRLGRFKSISKRMAFPLQWIQANQIQANNSVFIGNAAHTLHPVAGQGLNLGLGDVNTLAELIQHALTTQQNLGAATLTTAYQQRRHRPQQVISLFTHYLVTCFSNDLFPLTWLRNIGMIGMDHCTPAKRKFARYFMGIPQ